MIAVQVPDGSIGAQLNEAESVTRRGSQATTRYLSERARAKVIIIAGVAVSVNVD